MRLTRYWPFSQPLPDDHDDDIGFQLDEHGMVPEGLTGLHCKYCGEPVQPYVMAAWAKPYSVQEWYHSKELTVHCVFAWHYGVRASFAEETATPCRDPGCKSNDEHEAAQGDVPR